MRNGTARCPMASPYQTRWWIDDMYMITALQLQAYRATGDAKYLERAAREMVAYLDEAAAAEWPVLPRARRRRSTGDAVTAGWPWAWPRLLRDLPAEAQAAYKPMLAAYRKMMATLLTHQADNGMWRQLIDHPESWEETSSTAMFTYAFVTRREERLAAPRTPTVPPRARRGSRWSATSRPRRSARSVRGHGQAKNDLQYYLDRPRVAGDAHGQAPMMWTATALLR